MTSCPIPTQGGARIEPGHGAGGRLTQQLIDRIFRPAFGPDTGSHDGATLPAPAHRLAFTTDSFVITPLEFPGGDIGALSVIGTLNDLAMCGARPLWLSAGFILEEGLDLATLARLATSMGNAARDAGIRIVTGDTKVVERGKGDGLYITTAGIGQIPDHLGIAPSEIRPGDAVLLSGDIGRHGIAVMAARENLGLETTLTSDMANLSPLVEALLAAGITPHCLRDPTRGGLAGALAELAAAARLDIRIDESTIPISSAVRGACELLGLDPLYVANEGRLLAILPQAQAQTTLATLRTHPLARHAIQIGTVLPTTTGTALTTTLGGTRILDRPSGDQLPRIC